jgi:glutathione-regulated potassium-efflux system ancillary protein KefG
MRFTRAPAESHAAPIDNSKKPPGLCAWGAFSVQGNSNGFIYNQIKHRRSRYLLQHLCPLAMNLNNLLWHIDSPRFYLMARILIQFAHPALEKSRVNRRLLAAVESLDFVTVNDLYEQYPDFDIDVGREQELLLAHDYIVLHHPFYWYSSPAIIKQWEDLVLEHGWAYGRTGTALAGKRMLSAITTGGRQEAYQETGSNRFTIQQLLAPFEQTARLCKMDYLPPFVVHGSLRISEDELAAAAVRYRELLTLLATDQAEEYALLQSPSLNDLAT